MAASESAKIIRPDRFRINYAALGFGLAAAAVLVLLAKVNTDRMQGPAQRIVQNLPTPETKRLLPAGRGGNRIEGSTSSNEFLPAGATQLVYNTRDEGLQFTDGSDQPLRRLRYQTRETWQWRNPSTGASLRVSYPSDEIVLLRARCDGLHRDRAALHDRTAGDQRLVGGADHIQTEQVFVNILQNAIDAIRETRARRGEVEVQAGRAGDGMAEVVVHDTGGGLAADAVDRLFEPYFTTKTHGLGMGLAISRSIVEAHQGSLSVTPRAAGPGATVRVLLPLNPGRRARRGA